MSIFKILTLSRGGPLQLIGTVARGGVSAAQSAYGGRSGAVLDSVCQSREDRLPAPDPPQGSAGRGAINCR